MQTENFLLSTLSLTPSAADRPDQVTQITFERKITVTRRIVASRERGRGREGPITHNRRKIMFYLVLFKFFQVLDYVVGETRRQKILILEVWIRIQNFPSTRIFLSPVQTAGIWLLSQKASG